MIDCSGKRLLAIQAPPPINFLGVHEYASNDIFLNVFHYLNTLEISNFGVTCKRYHTISKNGPMWVDLCQRMENLGFIFKDKEKTCKDRFDEAIILGKPEACLAKCQLFYENKYIKRDYCIALNQIKDIVDSKIQLKIDLMKVELMVLESEFLDCDHFTTLQNALELLNTIYKNFNLNPDEKNWADCLYIIGNSYYLPYCDDIQRRQQFIQFCKDFESPCPSINAIISVYKGIVFHEHEHIYTCRNAFKTAINSPDLKIEFKTFAMLKLALSRYPNSSSEYFFETFQEIASNQFTFPKTKITAIIHQINMLYEHDYNFISYNEAYELLNIALKEKYLNKDQAELYQVLVSYKGNLGKLTLEQIFGKLQVLQSSNYLSGQEKTMLLLTVGMIYKDNNQFQDALTIFQLAHTTFGGVYSQKELAKKYINEINASLQGRCG